jgi:hypothetical protein
MAPETRLPDFEGLASSVGESSHAELTVRYATRMKLGPLLGPLQNRYTYA